MKLGPTKIEIIRENGSKQDFFEDGEVRITKIAMDENPLFKRIVTLIFPPLGTESDVIFDVRKEMI